MFLRFKHLAPKVPEKILKLEHLAPKASKKILRFKHWRRRCRRKEIEIRAFGAKGVEENFEIQAFGAEGAGDVSGWAQILSQHASITPHCGQRMCACSSRAGEPQRGQGGYATALREIRPLAEQGNAHAQSTLGYLYSSGKGVVQDYAKAALGAVNEPQSK